MKKKEVPTFDELMDPTVQALKHLGGSASIDELVPESCACWAFPKKWLMSPTERPAERNWSTDPPGLEPTYARLGFIENSERGIWALTPEGARVGSVDGRQIARDVAKQFQSERATDTESAGAPAAEEPEAALTWQDRLLAVLQGMDPIAFERLCQRILRESGFIEVEVTKRSGDGGIDGHGTIRIGGLISFNVLFQSKRYKGNIGPDIVRDFRGAMVGRADKGMIISTGGFTLEARREATRDGAPPLDLIDGRLLAEKLKELKLGVKTNLVEHVEVLDEWFRTI